MTEPEIIQEEARFWDRQEEIIEDLYKRPHDWRFAPKLARWIVRGRERLMKRWLLRRRAEVRRTVLRWLLGQAQEVFHSRHVRLARRMGLAAHRMTIKEMRSRWGSCGADGRMSVSWRLILAPMVVIDYVLAHELAHIVHQDHSQVFWKRVAAGCEHWRESRDWLRRNGDELDL